MSASRRREPLRDRLLLKPLAGFLSAVFRELSWEQAQGVGRQLGNLAFRLSRRDRRRALDHLARAFPDLDDPARGRLARAVFLHLGVTLGECLYLSDKDAAEVLRHTATEGWENVRAARETGRPLVVVTGHCGNWELLAALFGTLGVPLHVVARQLEVPVLDRMLLGLRSRFGSITIQRGLPGAPRALLRAVRDAAALGMAIDQDTRVEGVWVPFFALPAYTPVGAAEFALRFDAAVVTAFIERRADGSHLARFSPPLVLPADPVEATAALTRAIEAQVRRCPEQWVWFHRRWRTQPPAADGAPPPDP